MKSFHLSFKGTNRHKRLVQFKPFYALLLAICLFQMAAQASPTYPISKGDNHTDPEASTTAKPQSLVCNDLVYVSLDIDCVTEIQPADILEGNFGNAANYVVELDEVAPFGNGPWVPATVNANDVGQTYQVRVTETASGNRCWGSVKIEDKLAPEINCTDINLSCPITNYDPAYIQNTLHLTTAYPTVIDCTPFTLTYIDTWHDLTCNQGFNGVNDLSAYVTRKWTAKDAGNNTSTCIQYIYFHRVHVTDVLFPADVTVSCGSNVNTDPAATGAPYYKQFNINWKLFPDPGFCELQTVYADQILPVCDGTYKILRTWTVVDWCLPTTPYPPTQNPQYYIQVINVMDSQGPTMTCPANITVSTDPFACCATTNLPDLILTDNCSRLNNISAMVTTFDQYIPTLQTGMYTVGGNLTTFPGNITWNPDTLGDWGWTPCLPIGTHTVVYTATDDCGNTKTCSFKMKVEDQVPPVAVCDQTTVVALGANGQAQVNSITFDDGSYDNCGQVFIKARRSNGSSFSDQVSFSCSDVGTTVMVVLRAYDQSPGSGSVSTSTLEDHANDCMIQVQVQDKV
ncbi:MAG: HYR domain-containing protein, partial [Bacteroidota bacterium]